MAAVLEKCIIEYKWHAPIRCKKYLLAFAEDETDFDEFVNLKMRSSKLLPAAKSTVQICLSTEISMKKYNYAGKYNQIETEVLSSLDIDLLFWMSDFNSHQEPGHKMCLVKLIIEMYAKKKQDYISKCKTLDAHDTFVRSQLKKLIHFKGQ